MITQIPAGYLAQRFGPKLVLLANLSGTACCFGLLPAAVRSGSGSVWLPATLLCVMGLCQGSLIPGLQPQILLFAQIHLLHRYISSLLSFECACWCELLPFLWACAGEAAMHSVWLPHTIWRPFILQLMFLCHCSTNFIATWSTPALSARFGNWAAVNYTFGTAIGLLGFLWAALVSNRKPLCAQPKDDGTEGITKAIAEEDSVEWGVFRTASALSVCLCQVADNNLFDTIYLWAPVYFTQKFGVSPTSVPAFLAVPQAINTFGGLGVATLETILLQAGAPKLALRRLATFTGAVVETIAAFCYTRAKGATSAAAWLCMQAVGQLCHRAGFEQSYHEVGGPDTAIVASTGNALANGAGVVVPPASLLLRRAFNGSWTPHVLLGGAFKLLTAAFYCRSVTLTPARDSLRQAKIRDA
eukprot:SAG31_NODE_234_length_19701_cov_16.835068_4_plen_415_part_00